MTKGMVSHQHVENRIGTYLGEAMSCLTIGGLVRIREKADEYVRDYPDHPELIEMARRVHMMAIIRLGKLIRASETWREDTGRVGITLGLALVARRVALANASIRRRLLDDPKIPATSVGIREVLRA